jgi:hypothetical protein
VVVCGIPTYRMYGIDNPILLRENPNVFAKLSSTKPGEPVDEFRTSVVGFV